MRRQLTHEYVQKSMRTTRPRSSRSETGSELIQPTIPPSSGATGAVPAAASAGPSPVRRSWASSRFAVAFCSTLFCSGAWRGDRGREALVDADRDCDRGDPYQRAGETAGRLRVPAEEADTLGEPPAPDGDRQHRNGGAARIGHGHEERLEPTAAGRRERGHRGQDRPGAGDEDEAQARAEHDPAALGARPAACEAQKGSLHHPGHRREKERRRQQQEQDDREVAQCVLGKSQAVEQRRAGDGEDAEASDKAEDDPEGPPA